MTSISRTIAIVAIVIAAIGIGVVDAEERPQTTPTAARATSPTVMLVVDVSGSMSEEDANGVVKIEAAKLATLRFLDSVSPGTQLGLLTYPGPGSGGCTAGTMPFPIGARDPEAMGAHVRTLTPAGDTPTPQSLAAAADALRAAQVSEATIVLVSDGESTCGEPCETAREIASSGVDLDVISVGFQISGTGKEELQCVADATGGKYVDATDGAALETVLAELSRPDVRLMLEYPESVLADVGQGENGLVTVQAAVSNQGSLDALDAAVRLRFDIGSSPGVVAPLRRLGHLRPGTTRDVAWSFRPGVQLAGHRIKFTVIVTAKNSPEDVSEDGVVTVVNAATRKEAGPLFRSSKRIAVMGDSYSAGEGAHDYVAGTDVRGNRCHRSRLTYLVEPLALDLDASMVLACSGAVAIDVSRPAKLRGAGDRPDCARGYDLRCSQVDRLRALQDKAPVDAVVLTLGGNNMGFATVIEACIAHQRDCSEQILLQRTNDFVVSRQRSLSVELRTAYDAINAELNDGDVVKRRRRRAPIIALAYPRITPSSKRPCATVSQLSQSELDFVTRFITTLNGEVEAATNVARSLGTPVYFVPFSEDAFLPNHTVCDGEPYANGFESFEGYDEAAILAGLRTARLPGARLAGDEFWSEVQELFHPNPVGYHAISSAVIRWSRDTEGEAAANLPAKALGARVNPGDTVAEMLGAPQESGRLLQGGSPPVSVQGGTSYGVQVDGFAPGTQVELRVESDPIVVGIAHADDDGVVSRAVTLPVRIDPGRHHLVLEGFGDDGELRKVSIGLDVRPPKRLSGVAAVAGPFIGASIGLLLRGRRRIRPRSLGLEI